MNNTQSLSTTLKNELTSNLPVSLVSVFLAVVAMFVFSAISDSGTGGILLALTIAVYIPHAYERYWPVAYSTGAAAVWTLAAALITTGFFIGISQIAAGVLSTTLSFIVAFLVTTVVQYGSVALFARVRQR